MYSFFVGELCPVKVKGLASGVVACAAFGTIFLLVKLFPMMLSQLGQHGTYLFFAAVCLVLIVFTHFFVPETRYENSFENPRVVFVACWYLFSFQWKIYSRVADALSRPTGSWTSTRNGLIERKFYLAKDYHSKYWKENL